MDLLVKSCVVVLLLPYATASSACSDGNCQVDDEMYLMQLKHTLKAGIGRSVEDADYSADYSAEGLVQDARPISNELAHESDESAQQLDKLVEDLINEDGELDSELEVDMENDAADDTDFRKQANAADDMDFQEQETDLEPRSAYPNPPNKATPPTNGASDLQAFGSALEDQAQEDKSAANVGVDVGTSTNPALPATCTAYGPCVGQGPYCEGNSWDCEKIGMKVIGYVAACPGDTKVCTSGYKVQCAKCADTFTGAVYPTPAPFPSPWVTPLPGPTPAPAAAPTPAPAIVIPTNAPVFPPAPYNSSLVGNATLALKNAHALLKSMRIQLNNVTNRENAIKKNITMYTDIQKEAKEAHLRDRRAAVQFAKKKQLANITLAKVQKKMDDAFTAQKGAEQGALVHWGNAKNANEKMRYYKKQCISLKYQKEQVQQNYSTAKYAGQRAKSELQSAKKERRSQETRTKRDSVFKRSVAYSGTKTSQSMSVKQAMEDAFAAGSRDRNASLNVPPGGGKWWSHGHKWW